MKVVQINANADFGSTGLVVQGIHDIIEKNGGESFIAYQRCKCRPKKGYQLGCLWDWKFHALATRLFGHYGFYSKLATKRFLRYLDRVNPDIVHLHNIHSNFINIKLLLQYLADNNINTVLTLHDCWFFTGKCFHYVDVNCSRFIDGCHECPKRYSPPAYYMKDTSCKDWLEKKNLFNSIDRLTVVGCSEWIAREASKSFLKSKKITFINNGIDTTIFTPIKTNLRQSLHIPEDAFVIMGMANKWFLRNNQAVLDRIFNLKDVHVLIIGCTKKHLSLRKYLPSNVRLEGFISSRSDMAQYYSISDVFVNLTHADTFPTVNMESICCGTPVVTYDVGGCSELILEGTGYVIKEDDVESIISAIQEIRSKSLEHCSEVGQRQFNREMCFSKYINLYCQLNKK